MARLFKKGDVVKVYSLQSFFDGGFLKGEEGIVYQDQLPNDSVLVTVKRLIDGKRRVDPSYEVYQEQLRLVGKATKKKQLLDKFDELLRELEGKDE